MGFQTVCHGAVRNLKGAANFFDKTKYYSFSIEICLGCREKNLVSFRVPRAKKFENH